VFIPLLDKIFKEEKRRRENKIFDTVLKKDEGGKKEIKGSTAKRQIVKEYNNVRDK